MTTEAPTKIPDALHQSRLLNCHQVQEMMNISRTTLQRLIHNKTDPLPSLKFLKTRRFQLDKVLWWIEKQES